MKALIAQATPVTQQSQDSHAPAKEPKWGDKTLQENPPKYHTALLWCKGTWTHGGHLLPAALENNSAWVLSLGEGTFRRWWHTVPPPPRTFAWRLGKKPFWCAPSRLLDHHGLERAGQLRSTNCFPPRCSCEQFCRQKLNIVTLHRFVDSWFSVLKNY